MTISVTSEELLERIATGWRSIREAVAAAGPDRLGRRFFEIVSEATIEHVAEYIPELR